MLKVCAKLNSDCLVLIPWTNSEELVLDGQRMENENVKENEKKIPKIGRKREKWDNYWNWKSKLMVFTYSWEHI